MSCDIVKKELVLKEFLISPKIGLMQFLTRLITNLNKINFENKVHQTSEMALFFKYLMN